MSNTPIHFGPVSAGRPLPTISELRAYAQIGADNTRSLYAVIHDGGSGGHAFIYYGSNKKWARELAEGYGTEVEFFKPCKKLEEAR